ncbi:MAG: hypothetical protein RMK20_00920 [Verrucomicrobiales bacterium]|nr:hypothetical protein [Verrucomicrobiales bacterium]
MKFGVPQKLGGLLTKAPDSISECPAQSKRPPPPSNRDSGSGLSFADEHSEMHVWRGSKIKPPVIGVTTPLVLDTSDSTQDMVR